jgi:BirA family biotin operon repressor/biotin-[acetyl-CoA-carboxylase] ligase
MELYSLLSLLSDGEFHSGSELGVSLNVSRTSIWKALGQLSDINLEIETVKGKGYRLVNPLDLLSSSEVSEQLSPAQLSSLELNLPFSVDSTNAWLISNSVLGKEFNVCMAEYQTDGKGRRGRSWVSPFGRNIYLSLGFDLSGGVDALSGLSLVVGLAVVKALKKLGVVNPQLKWPNDVLIDGKKIAGILVELQGEATTSWRVITGIGLNVAMNDNEGRDIDQPWARLRDYVDDSRSKIAGVLIAELLEVFTEFKSKGFAGFIDEWSAYDALAGQQVTVNSGAMSGKVLGVDRSGALMLETQSGQELVNAGEVTIRKL